MRWKNMRLNFSFIAKVSAGLSSLWKSIRFNFGWLAEVSTGPSPWLKGFLPPIGAIIALFGVSCAIASGIWLWGIVLQNAIAFLPLLGHMTIGVIALALGNFWFNREINRVLLSAREFPPGATFGEGIDLEKLLKETNRVISMAHQTPPEGALELIEREKVLRKGMDVQKMVEHLTAELNAHFIFHDPDYQYMPPPRIGYYTNADPKIVTIEGRSYEEAAIYFSSAMLNPDVTNLSQPQLAALIQLELVKIYERRGISSAAVAIVKDLLSTLDNIVSKDRLYAMMGCLVTPLLQFFVLVPYSVWRSYSLKAATEVVKCGRGIDLIEATLKKMCPSINLATVPFPAMVAKIKKESRRKKYQGPMADYLQPFTDWIDQHQWLSDNKINWRGIIFLEELVAEAGTYWGELNGKDPRNTSMLKHLYPQVDYHQIGQDLDLSELPTIGQAELNILRLNQKKINQMLFTAIFKGSRYSPICVSTSEDSEIQDDASYSLAVSI